MKRSALSFLLAALVGCTSAVDIISPGTPSDPNDPTDPIDPPPPPPPGAVEITSPAEGAVFDRDEFNAQFEFITAPIVFTASVTEPRITQIEYTTENGFSLGIGVAPDFEITAPFSIDGNRTITGRGKDANGVEIATAQISFQVTPPIDENCLSRLTQAGVTFTQPAPILGIHTPVRFFSPMVGITYLPFGASAPRADGELASCALAETLVNMAPVLAAQGITKVEHLGIYNFRCIGGGNPQTDNCNPSQHAFARGIDIHELRKADGTTFNVETDFVIDTDATCTSATSNAKDQLLHTVACGILNPGQIFSIVLTPNFNAAHRNHFHVDITAGSNFIRSLFRVDPVDTGMIGH